MDFNFNISKFIRDLVPISLRKDRLLDWLKSCVKAIDVLKLDLVSYTDDTRDRLKYNGQTISLQNLLASKFGQGISITNSNSGVSPFYLYPSGDSRNSSVFNSNSLENPFIYPVNTVDLDAVDFVVEVPANIVFDESEMTASIREYTLYSRTFKILVV